MAIGETWQLVGNLPKEINNHAVIEFNSKLWVIGGLNLENTMENNVYSSEDGINWTYHNSHVKFNLPNITEARPFVLGTNLFIAGGIDSTPAVTDKIFATKDGNKWVEVGKLPQPMTYFDIAVKNDRVYAIGGSSDGTDVLDNVYMSKDGIVWNELTPIPNPLAQHTVTIWNDLLLIIGGYRTGGEMFVLNDKIFNSIDGEYWGNDGSYPDSGKSFIEQFPVTFLDDVFPTVGGGSDGLDNQSAIVYNDELYFIGGRGCISGCSSDQVFKTDNPIFHADPMFTEVGINALPYETLGRNVILFQDAFWGIGLWEQGIGATDKIYKSIA
jgi:hypothetical protein